MLWAAPWEEMHLQSNRIAFDKSWRRLGNFRRKALAKAMAKGPSSAILLIYARLNKLDFVQFGVRRAFMPFRVRTLRKPEGPPQMPSEPVVLSVVRNGMPWLHTFLDHHRALGARRFVVLDNGSTDGSLDFLLRQNDVLLLASTAPYRHYENTFKRYICDRYARERWCLFVDVDELIAYPGMDRHDLAALIRFVSEQGYDAVLTQMLDLYSDAPMAEIPDTTDLDLREVHRFYETHDINSRNYVESPGAIIPANARMHVGGVRHRLFGTLNGLTKVSLFFNGGALRPFVNWHHARNAKIADFSIALLHFPFNREYRDKVIEAASSGRYGWLTSDEYEAYAAIMKDNPQLVLKGERSVRLDRLEQLVEEGFLQVSPAYAAWSGLGEQAASGSRVGP